MNIVIEKQSDHYRADCKDLPGSPPVGLGETPEMAVACLFFRMLFDKPNHSDSSNWTKYIKKDEPIKVNDKTWSWPASYQSNFR